MAINVLILGLSILLISVDSKVTRNGRNANVQIVKSNEVGEFHYVDNGSGQMSQITSSNVNTNNYKKSDSYQKNWSQENLNVDENAHKEFGQLKPPRLESLNGNNYDTASEVPGIGEITAGNQLQGQHQNRYAYQKLQNQPQNGANNNQIFDGLSPAPIMPNGFQPNKEVSQKQKNAPPPYSYQFFTSHIQKIPKSNKLTNDNRPQEESSPSSALKENGSNYNSPSPSSSQQNNGYNYDRPFGNNPQDERPQSAPKENGYYYNSPSANNPQHNNEYNYDRQSGNNAEILTQQEFQQSSQNGFNQQSVFNVQSGPQGFSKQFASVSNQNVPAASNEEPAYSPRPANFHPHQNRFRFEPATSKQPALYPTRSTTQKSVITFNRNPIDRIDDSSNLNELPLYPPLGDFEGPTNEVSNGLPASMESHSRANQGFYTAAEELQKVLKTNMNIGTGGDIRNIRNINNFLAEN